MRAISTVIASILMLMIVIGLGGVTYLYISGVFTGKTATIFEVIESVNDTVIIKNSGTEPIRTMTATLDGNSVNIAITPTLSGLVGYWSLNEGNPSQTTIDSSNNKNHGTLKPSCPNCPSWTTGQFNNGLQFDGLDDYVQVLDSASLDITNEITISLWVSIPSHKGSNDVLDKGVSYSPPNSAGYFISFDGTGKVNYQLGIVNDWLNVIGSTTVTTNTWHHIALTYDGTTVRGYVDGQLDGSWVKSGLIGTNNANLHIGARSGLMVNQFFNGKVDEISIYNKALIQSEIQELYSGLVFPGQLATVKTLSTSKGAHTLRLCTSSMCNTAYLTIN